MPCIQNLYTFNDVLSGQMLLPSNFLQLTAETALYAFLAETFAWASIFAVKFSFLFVFRPLVRRQRAPRIMWWCITIFCVPATAISVSAPWILCPYGSTNGLSEYIPRYSDFLIPWIH